MDTQTNNQNNNKKANIIKELFSLSFLKDLKWYEWTIIACMTLAQLLLTIFTETNIGSAIFNYSISLAGFLYVVCASRCSFWIFVFGLYQPLAYGFVCLHSQVFGEMIVNFAYFVPMQIIGIILWLKNYKKNPSHQTNVTVKRLNLKSYYLFVPILIMCYIGIYLLLSLIDGQRLPYLDAFISVMSIVGTLLLTLRYVENWYAYIIVNVASSILWLMLTIQGNANAPYILILNITYTLYSIIGLVKWLKYSKNNKNILINNQENINE